MAGEFKKSSVDGFLFLVKLPWFAIVIIARWFITFTRHVDTPATRELTTEDAIEFADRVTDVAGKGIERGFETIATEAKASAKLFD